MSESISLGWVGVRGYGRKLWNAVKDSNLRVRINACYHKDIRVAREAAQFMGGKAMTNFEELLQLSEIDAVVLTVPNEFHFSYTKRALESKKHVFVEKPLTNTVNEGEFLINLAKEKSLVLTVGHNYRKNGFIQKIKEELDIGRIGKPVAVEINMGHGGGLKFKSHQWRFHKEKCPGGPLNMLGVHLIDAVNFFFGTPVNVTGTVKNLHADTTAEDMSMIQLSYENGVVANITNLYNSVSTEYINIYGNEGALRFSRWPVEGLWFQPKDINCDCADFQLLEYEEVNSEKMIFEDFIQAIQSNTSTLTNSQEALEAVKVMEAAINCNKHNAVS